VGDGPAGASRQNNGTADGGRWLLAMDDERVPRLILARAVESVGFILDGAACACPAHPAGGPEPADCEVDPAGGAAITGRLPMLDDTLLAFRQWDADFLWPRLALDLEPGAVGHLGLHPCRVALSASCMGRGGATPRRDRLLAFTHAQRRAGTHPE